MGLSIVSGWLTRRLKLPITRDHDVDDPETTALRREIIRGKPFLKRIYEDWYRAIASELPMGPGPVLELGAGAGFMSTRIPRVIASDVLHVPGIDLVADARALPFGRNTLRAIVMTNVFHHIPDVRAFLADAARCVRPGGALVMIEPWVSPWSSLVYRYFHAEPFAPDAMVWTLPPGGPLSGANGALPWIVFARDQRAFEREFPEWQIGSVQPMMPLRYLLSGGVSMRALAPRATYRCWAALEWLLTPCLPWCGMFARIVAIRTVSRSSDSDISSAAAADV